VSFPAYDLVGPRRYRERVGLDLEALRAGQVFRHRPGVTVSQQDNLEEALLTSNQAMLHFDAAYAGATEWARPLVVSTLTLRLVLGMTDKTFGRRARLVGFDEIALTAPVFGGDTLYAESEVLAVEPEPGRDDVGALMVATRGVDQSGRVVCRATYRALVYRAGRGPDDGPGAGSATAGGDPVGKRPSHREVAPSVYLEQSGVDYEDFEPGEVYEHRPGHTFTAERALLRALRALNQSPPRVELEAARAAPGGRLAIPEVDVVGAATALSTKTFGQVAANLGWTAVSFPHAVHEGDTIHAVSTVLGKREAASRSGQGILHVRTEARTTAGELACRFERRLLVYRRGVGPHAAAGY